MTNQQKLAEALSFHQQKKYREAAALYQSILNETPYHLDTLYHFSILLAEANQFENSISLIQQAIAIVPQEPHFHFTLAEIYRHSNALKLALNSYKESLKLDSHFSSARYQLARILCQTQETEKAIEHYHILLDTNFMPYLIHNDLGNLYSQQENYPQALKHYQQALDLKPDFVEVYNNLGNLYTSTQQIKEAIHHFKEALNIQDDFYHAHFNLGNLYKAQDFYNEARLHYKKTLDINPTDYQTHLNLGSVEYKQGNISQALHHYKQALTIKNDYSSAHFNLANLYSHELQYSQAQYHYLKVLEKNPDDCKVYLNLGTISYLKGELHQALEFYRSALNINPHYMDAQLNQWLTQLYLPEVNPVDLHKQISNWGQSFPSKHHSIEIKKETLTIGYLSSEFYYHSAHHMLQALLSYKDTDSFQLICFSNVKDPDKMTIKLQNLSDHWHDISSLSETEILHLIEGKVDILIDPGMGYTMGKMMNIFLKQPAPLQISLFPVTMGAGFDYLISDQWLSMPKNEQQFQEKVLYLSDSLFRFIPPNKSPKIISSPYLKKGYITYGSFNNLAKLNPQIVEAWSEILKKTPHSRLILKALALNDPSTRQRYQELLFSFGITQSQVEFMPYSPDNYTHLEDHQKIDIMLDSWPFSGHITSLEALWMGVPIITCCSNRTFGRVTSSFLTILGMEDLIANHLDEYIQLAIKLSEQPRKITQIHQTLRQKLLNSCLTDLQGYTQSIYNLYRRAWNEKFMSG